MGLCFSSAKVSGRRNHSPRSPNPNPLTVAKHRPPQTPCSFLAVTIQKDHRTQPRRSPATTKKTPPQTQTQTRQTPPHGKGREKAGNNNNNNKGKRHGEAIPYGKRVDFGYAKDFDNRYTIGKLLGHGQFGYTYVATDKKTGDRVAVKKIDKAKMTIPIAVEDVKREVKILQALTGHENVVRFYNAFEDKNSVYIAMELCEGGELLDRILAKKESRYSERDAAVVVRQMLKVAAECHLRGLVHRDMKPEVLKNKPDFRRKPWPTVSNSAKDFVRKLLVKDPRARLTAAQALSHPWVREGGDASEIPIDISVLNNMRQFVKFSRLKQFALRALATTLDEEESADLRDQFDAIDVDKNGAISLDEMRQALAKDHPWKLKDARVAEILQAIDSNTDGFVDFEEFVAAALHVNQLEEHDSEKWQQRSRAAFEKFDIDGDGFITAEELRMHTGLKGSIEPLLEEADIDNDGKISLHEFRRLLRTASIKSRNVRNPPGYLVSRKVSKQLEPWFELKDKVVLVTGASSGIGREICLDLPKAGCKIIAAARRVDRLKSLCSEINTTGVQAAALELDVSSDAATIQQAVKEAWKVFGKIDALVNNAGIRGTVKSSLDLSENEWDKVFKTNLMGAWLVSKYVCILMCDAKQGGGSVINISSVSGLHRSLSYGAVAYASSKSGVDTMTRAMAIELGVYNIRVNSIAPGLFKSEITQALIQKKWFKNVTDRIFPLTAEQTVDPGLTSLVRYLIHDSSQYVSGNVFIVDAGATLPGLPIFSSL
ncbi:hypothetical protein HID58_023220 [Brassica napus]|uniref:3-oxoacyl-[acyl-carrier-protein] reductase n=1 Tax=Brassica napus TaxID=3708 RepID=A0ABQ8D1H3_BRANA|nr:hypothetical protein HID58_023220 [Brassica napus]